MLAGRVRISIYMVSVPLLSAQGNGSLVNAFVTSLILRVLSFITRGRQRGVGGQRTRNVTTTGLGNIGFNHPRMAAPPSFREVVGR